MVYLLIGLMVLFIRNVLASGEDDLNSCLLLFNPDGVDEMCCQSLESFETFDNNYDGCLKEDSDEWMCEDYQCILNKTGMLKDGTVDDNGANKFYDKLKIEYPKETATIERVRSECLGGKFETYPPEDGCAAVKFFVCGYVNTFLECDSWKATEVCLEMAQNSAKCKTALGG